MSDSPQLALRSLTVTPYGAPKALYFNDVDELKKWLGRESVAWQVFHLSFLHGESSPIRQHHDVLREAQIAASSFTSGSDGSSWDAVSSALRSLERPPFLASDAAGVSYMMEMGRANPAAVDLMFRFLIGWPVLCGSQDAVDLTPLLRVVAHWRDHDGGSGAQAASFKRNINDRLGEWEREFGALRVFTTELSERAESVSAAVKNYQEQLAELLQEKAASLAHIEKTYTEYMRLKAPADYWREKAVSHKQLARRWLRALLGLLGVGLVGVLACYVFYLYDWIEHLSKPNAGAVSALLVGLPVLLYLSLVKVAHKSYRDEGRHAADAEQRTTLVQTYLALVNDNDEGVRSGERLLALHAVFRGSAQADGPDDTPPVNTLEALVQGLKPKAS